MAKSSRLMGVYQMDRLLVAVQVDAGGRLQVVRGSRETALSIMDTARQKAKSRGMGTLSYLELVNVLDQVFDGVVYAVELKPAGR